MMRTTGQVPPVSSRSLAMEYLQAVIVPLCNEKNQKFIIEVDPIPGLVPIMDPLRVNQVFFNLLSNSVKYTPEGGEIIYHLDEKQMDNGRVALHASISDNGIGMSAAFQKVLFEPFTQENRDDVSRNRGTGLGLTIAKKMMDLMGGSITVDSAIGRGTRFDICAEFDCIDSAELTEKKENTNVEKGYGRLTGKHVLVCEDHPLNQEITRALLEDKGMNDYMEKDKKCIAATYGRYARVIDHGSGALCVDTEGRELIDFTAGIGVNSLGFCDHGRKP